MSKDVISVSGTGHLINFVFGSRCLLSAVSRPHRLPACYCYKRVVRLPH